MKPDSSGMVHHMAQCHECDFSVGAKNCIGLASQHAEKTGHYVTAETGHSYAWNSGEK